MNLDKPFEDFEELDDLEEGNITWDHEDQLYENEYSDDPDEEVEYQLGEAMALIEKLPEEALKEVALKAVLMDEGLKSLLTLKYDFKMDRRLMRRLKREISSTIIDRMNDEFFIEEDEIEELFDDLDDFISDKIPILLDHGCALEAFKLIGFLLTELGGTELDDPDNEAENFILDTVVQWLETAEGLNEEELSEVRIWFEDIDLDRIYSLAVAEAIENTRNELFSTKEYMLERIAKLDKILKANKGKREAKVFDFPAFGSMDAVIQRIGYMRKLGVSEEEIARFREEYRTLRPLHDHECSQALAKEDYERAIELLKEAKVLDKGEDYWVEWYSDALVCLYQKLGRTEDYKAELFYQMNTFGFDSEEYREMRALCETKEEWESIKKELRKNWKFDVMLGEDPDGK